MKKIVVIIISIIVGIAFLFWLTVKDQHPDVQSEKVDKDYFDKLKFIHFQNNIDTSSYIVYMNFQYTQDDSLVYPGAKMDSLLSFNKADSLIIFYRPINNRNIFLPIFKRDSIAFPKSFSIKIYAKDSNKLLKELNYDSFIENALCDDTLVNCDPLTSASWDLIIDSTLLGQGN